MYDVFMYSVGAIVFVIIAIFLFYLSRIFNHYLARWRRHRDKEMMRLAIEQEAYYNDLYEETLTEKMDGIANQSLKKMKKYGR